MSSPINSRLATPIDISIIAPIVFACATRLKDQNHQDWSRYYTEDRLKEKLNSQTSYIFSIDNIPVGVVFLSSNDLYYYSAIDMAKFTEPTSSALFISTLAVSPEFQHQGIATQIINFCEKIATDSGVKFLRLDCNGNDEPLVNFYKKRGFTVLSPMSEEPEYLLMEKKII